ncbi:MAG: aldehyde dehydrogenase [Elusimicrobiota bacterium]|nr:aldehyde dehydrogenase [Elusimicrobiota bacterium]
MDITREEISKIVREVVSRLEESGSPAPVPSGGSVLYETMPEAIAAAKDAQEKFKGMGLQLRRKVIAAMREAAAREAENLAKSAASETGMGRWNDKVKKNMLAADKTPGVEDLQPAAYTGDRGLTLVENAPFGVIGAVAPSTNPTSTVINNAISIIAAGNSVVFAPHPAAKKSSQEAMICLSEAISSAGAPANLITAMSEPSLEGARILFTHEDIKVLLVTGGPAVVAAAMKSNKKVIAAGPGNPPVVVDETADIKKTVSSVIQGASFDNGVLCTAEKEVLLTDGAFDGVINEMRRRTEAYELTTEQMDRLAGIVIAESGKGGGEGSMNRDYVGRDAAVIAKAIGLNIPAGARLLWGVVDKDHDFMWTEQLMPVLPFARTGKITETIDLAVRLEGGNGHTAIMHSLNVEHLTAMARKGACSIFVKNGPSFMGLGMGEGYAALSIATPTGDGLVKARNFTRPLRCALVDYFRIA